MARKKASTKTPLAQRGHTSFESQYFSGNLMKGRRALPTTVALTGQKPRQRLSQTFLLAFLDA